MTDQPLAGVKILVTRAALQSKNFSAKLTALGALVEEMSLVEFAPPDSWQKLDRAIARINEYDWIMFASANGVKAFVDRLNKLKIEASSSPTIAQIKAKIAVIGESTGRAADEAGLAVSFQPRSFIAEDFVANFPGYPSLSGVKILWPRTNVGRPYIEEKFATAGASLDIAPAYKTCLPQDAEALAKRFSDLAKQKKIDVITLTSSQTAANLSSIVNDKSILEHILIVSIGPETSNGALNYLGKVDLQAKTHTVEGLIETLVSHFAESKDELKNFIKSDTDY